MVLEELANKNASRVTTKLNSMESVVAGNTAVLRCPVGLIYHKVIMRYSGITLAQMKEIVWKVGTKVIRRYKNGEEVKMINDFYAREEESGFLTFWFSEDEFNQLYQRDNFSIPTYGARSFNLEIDIDNAAANPVMEFWAVNGAPNETNNLGGSIVKIRRLPSIPLVQGENDITTIPPLSFIKSIHFKTNNMTSLRLLSDTVEVLNVDVDVTKALQKQAKYARVPSSNVFTFDWTLTGTPNSAIMAQGVRDLRFKPVMSTTETVDVVVEYIDSVGGPV